MSGTYLQAVYLWQGHHDNIVCKLLGVSLTPPPLSAVSLEGNSPAGAAVLLNTLHEILRGSGIRAEIDDYIYTANRVVFILCLHIYQAVNDNEFKTDVSGR